MLGCDFLFVGAINREAQCIIFEAAQKWKDMPIYVGCSGNFTIERVLNAAGCENIVSNDVSLYSCCIGNFLAGRKTDISIKDDRYLWLYDFMDTEVDKIATLLICSEMLKYDGKSQFFYQRMYQQYEKNFADLHKKTVEKTKEPLENIRIREFIAGDVLDFMSDAEKEGVFIAYPPTYKSGYEKLYEKIDSVFSWQNPEYEIFDGEREEELLEVIRAKDKWLYVTDKILPENEENVVAKTKTGIRSKPVYYYSNDGQKKRITKMRQKTECIKTPRFGEDDEISEKSVLSVERISQYKMNTLRSQYLSVGIMPANAMANFCVLLDGKIIGAIAFSSGKYSRSKSEAYMMTDLAIRPTKYKKLSKLILAAAVSEEVQEMLQRCLKMRVTDIVTTAFTEKSVSMKYRGLFKLDSRKEGRLNYSSKAGVWTLQEGLEWWIKKHSKK